MVRMPSCESRGGSFGLGEKKEIYAGSNSNYDKRIYCRCKNEMDRMETSHSGLNDEEIDALIIGPFTGSPTHLLAPLTHLLAPHCSLCLLALLRSFARLLAHSLAPELMGKRFFVFKS